MNNSMSDNKERVLKNDNNIKPQVPGITTNKEKRDPSRELKDQEIFYRAVNI